tara:strand:+ start:1568 stop:2176 length:609 start_codon:yes stop_codon:yes gene_type:complete
MNLNYSYYYFKGALTPRFCKEIIDFAKSKKEVLGRTGNIEDKNLNKKQIKNIQKDRDSNVCWMDDRWIYREILPYVKEANINAGWNFQWDQSENCQFTIYKKNQYYDWHCDSWDKPYAKGPSKGKIRKLSVTCSLSDPEDYKGGELEFHKSTVKKNKKMICSEIAEKGSIVVFPSFVYHRVKPVTKGVRYSLVVWNLGNPFI